ncbi:hypothetical protein D3C81_2132470 [compost metagenome]
MPFRHSAFILRQVWVASSRYNCVSSQPLSSANPRTKSLSNVASFPDRDRVAYCANRASA